MIDKLFLTDKQESLLKSVFEITPRRFTKYKFRDIFNAILYVIKTGVQWLYLPPNFPPFQIVYHHFRHWSAKGLMEKALQLLLKNRRNALGQSPYPEVGIIDSRSVRSGNSRSEKGVDGHKRIKGIKNHICVDSNGYLLAVNVTRANVHDSKGIIDVINILKTNHSSLKSLKADLGYRNIDSELLSDLTLDCVKSNFGTKDFVPLQGRWVVERTFSWMDNYRRLCRNYEIHLSVAKEMFVAAALIFMLRYFS